MKKLFILAFMYINLAYAMNDDFNVKVGVIENIEIEIPMSVIEKFGNKAIELQHLLANRTITPELCSKFPHKKYSSEEITKAEKEHSSINERMDEIELVINPIVEQYFPLSGSCNLFEEASHQKRRFEKIIGLIGEFYQQQLK